MGGILASSQRTHTITAGRFFFIWIGGEEGVECAPGHQLGDGVADHLAGQVVEVGLEHPDPIAIRR